MDGTLRVGILGGTFNPVHKGHIQLGLNIREAFKLDEILYVLSANPPHKKSPEMVPAEIRWDMLNKALAPYPFLVPCDLEMKRPLDSWTIVTAAELKKARPQSRFYFLSGSEGFLKIRTWKDYKKLLHSLTFIVLIREERHKPLVEALLGEEGITPYPFSGDYPGDSEGPGTAYLYAYRSDLLHLSSTQIRGKIKSSERIDQFVHEEVKKIMEAKNLYENR
jgi:nicotinate-nucleotide adenylyltransferase